MTGQGISQLVVYALALVAFGYPLGIWMSRVYTSANPAGKFLGSIERGCARFVFVGIQHVLFGRLKLFFGGQIFGVRFADFGIGAGLFQQFPFHLFERQLRAPRIGLG